MTIKELRNRDAERLARRQNPDPTPAEMEAAQKTMKLYYRFVAAYQKSFYTEQDSRATQADRDNADQKSEKAYTRAKEALKKYNLRISCPGLYPIIDDMNGTNFTYGHFYN